jgi:hypothetical protein
MEIPLAILFVVGVFFYIAKTTEDQRQMHLLGAWIFLGLGSVFTVLKHLL